MYEGVPLCIEPPTPAAHVARDVGCGLGALLVLCLGVLCFRVKQRRWWWRATCGRFSRALLPHVECLRFRQDHETFGPHLRSKILELLFNLPAQNLLGSAHEILSLLSSV